MNKLLSAPTLLFALLLLIVACKKNDETTNENQIIVTRNGCSNVKAYAGVRICYDSLIEDSRCPKDLICNWAGLALIKVTFNENGNVHRFKMLYMLGNSRNYNHIYGVVSDTSINGYQIKLTDVLPYPKSPLPPPASNQYKAVFTITH